MHDGMQCDPIQGQGQGHEPFKVGNLAVYNSYLRHLQWELARILKPGTMSKFGQARFFIFGVVFVSRDFEVGRNVSSEESTVSLIRG